MRKTNRAVIAQIAMNLEGTGGRKPSVLIETYLLRRVDGGGLEIVASFVKGLNEDDGAIISSQLAGEMTPDAKPKVRRLNKTVWDMIREKDRDSIELLAFEMGLIVDPCSARDLEMISDLVQPGEALRRCLP